MIRLSISTNEIGAEGELIEHFVAACEIRGQEVTMTGGDEQFVPIGMPVFSERYDRLIDFDLDGEEWARNLPRAYRNGAIAVTVEDLTESASAFSARETVSADLYAQQG